MLSPRNLIETIPRFALYVAVALTAAACADDTAPRKPAPNPDVHPLTLVTYDGSGQAVHPDAAATPATWVGTRTELFATPYPYGDAARENPSLYSRISLLEWVVPEGVTNPIARTEQGYLSDPDDVFNPETNELWLYYRGVTSENQIYLMRGTTPSSWGQPALVASGPNHTIVSPTVVRRAAGDWLMWSVNSGTAGCSSSTTTVELRRSADGVTWSPAVATDLSETDAFAWHIDVQWIPSRQEFWATYNVKIPGSCTTPALHFARSTDGVHWVTAVGAVLVRGAIPEFADIVYRSTLLYDEASDQVTLWYSGATFGDQGYTWRIATERLSLSSFLERLATPTPGGGLAVTNQPPLTNESAP